ncbi:F-box/LRR-repeat protein At4g14103-like [Triticum aestivum]|uniref:F-box/LRR-repeat protein At4g14103-like n=1 Tax=Triticum aestivum TaxID=4565 RepID=UPI001D03517D|nr:F-box/LRR-repeat protein At4g14103-like [Triticum aestivum]
MTTAGSPTPPAPVTSAAPTTAVFMPEEVTSILRDLVTAVQGIHRYLAGPPAPPPAATTAAYGHPALPWPSQGAPAMGGPPLPPFQAGHPSGPPPPLLHLPWSSVPAVIAGAHLSFQPPPAPVPSWPQWPVPVLAAPFAPSAPALAPQWPHWPAPAPAAPPAPKRKGTSSGIRDRLSDLPDALLGHVLSFLPNKEAGRAAGLSRRWRDVFCNVHAVSFGERPGARATDWTTFYHEADEKKSCSAALLDDVCSALLCRRRTAGHHVPLRSFRFAFDRCHHWNFVHVDQWLSYALRHGDQELHLDLRFKIAPICDDKAVDSGTDNTDDEDGSSKLRRRWVYVLPRRLFTCRVIRTLCVAYCRLILPAAVNLPLLETLSITAPHSDGGRSIQRLISSCPRLVDLTLEAVHRLKRVSVLDQCLRRFALRCCHNLKSVDIDASELRSLDYCGTVPAGPLLSLHGSPRVPSCTVDFCRVLPEDAGFTGFRVFMQKISDAKHLHLHHRRLESRFFLGFPPFSSLTRLVLQGPLEHCGAVVSVGRILEQTPNLEVLTLFMEEQAAHTKNRDDTMGEIESWVVADAEKVFL